MYLNDIYTYQFIRIIGWVPHGALVEVECWLCNPRVSGSNSDAGNLEKVVYLDENSWTQTKTQYRPVGEMIMPATV